MAPETKPRVLAGAFLAGYDSERTRSAYRRDLVDWFTWCSRHQLDPLAAERHHVQLYARELEHVGRTPATVARRLASLAGLYRYAVEEGYLDRSPAAHVLRPRVSQDSQTLGLDRDELVRFLEAAEAASPRDHALACLLGLNGLRISEACGADVGDLGESAGTARSPSRARAAARP